MKYIGQHPHVTTHKATKTTPNNLNQQPKQLRDIINTIHRVVAVIILQYIVWSGTADYTSFTYN